MLQYIQALEDDFARKGFDNYRLMLRSAYMVGNFSFFKTTESPYPAAHGNTEQIKFRFVVFNDKKNGSSHVLCANAAVVQSSGPGLAGPKHEIAQKNFWIEEYPLLTKRQMLREIQLIRSSIEPGVQKAINILETRKHTNRGENAIRSAKLKKSGQ